MAVAEIAAVAAVVVAAAAMKPTVPSVIVSVASPAVSWLLRAVAEMPVVEQQALFGLVELAGANLPVTS